MKKLLFAPVRAIAGLIAGLTGRKLFTGLWRVLDDAPAPSPEQRGASWPKLLGALLLQGAVFSVVRGAVDHAARRAFARATGRWPGEQDPPPAER